MKKRIAVFAVAAALIFCGCGKKAPAVTDADAVIINPNAPKTTEAPAQESAGATAEPAGAPAYEVPEDDPYAFVTNGIKILPLMNADEVIAALGQWKYYCEAESCANQGKDLFYKYSGFELAVNEDNGVNIVTSIAVVDDTIQAQFENGSLRIGDSVEKLLSVLGGEPGKEFYSYRSAGVHLQVSLKDGKVNTIVYLAPEEYAD